MRSVGDWGSRPPLPSSVGQMLWLHLGVAGPNGGPISLPLRKVDDLVMDEGRRPGSLQETQDNLPQAITVPHALLARADEIIE